MSSRILLTKHLRLLRLNVGRSPASRDSSCVFYSTKNQGDKSKFSNLHFDDQPQGHSAPLRKKKAKGPPTIKKRKDVRVSNFSH